MSEEAPRPEVIVARLRPHGRALFWPTLALIVIAAATGYFAGRFPQGWENLALLGVAAVLVLLLWLVPVIRWLGRNYTITDRRTVVRAGFAVRSRQELLHSRGYDVTLRRAGLQSIFRSGDILINAGHERPIVLRDVPRAGLVLAALQDLIERTPTERFDPGNSSEAVAPRDHLR